MRIPFVLAILYLSFAAILAARIAFSLHALQLGASAFEVGVLAAASHGPALLLSFAIGLMADRFSARRLLALSLLCGTAGLVLAWLLPGLPTLYAASALCGIWSAFVSVLMQQLIGGLSRPEALTRNFSNQALTASLAGLSGPLLAGFAIEHLGHARAMLVLLPFAALVALLLLVGGGLLPRARRNAGAAPESGTFATPRLWRLMLISGAVQLAVELYPFYLPLYGHAIGLSASTIGVAISSVYVASFCVRIVLPRVVGRYGEERMLACALATSALAFALVPVCESAPALVAVSLVQGMGMAFGGPLVLMLLYRGVPRERAGAALGLRMTANSAVRVAAPPAFGALAAAFGLPGVFLATAALIGASGWAIGRRKGRASR